MAVVATASGCGAHRQEMRNAADEPEKVQAEADSGVDEASMPDAASGAAINSV